MRIRFIQLCAPLALVPLFGACNKDSATTPTTHMLGPRASVVTPNDTGGGGGGGPGNQSHFVANGDFASTNWGDSLGGGGFTFGSLGVNRGGAVNNPQAFLSYFIEQCDPFFNCTFQGGFGQIPASDVSGGGRQLRLSTNTSGNPNFFTFGGPPGLITVDWSANGFFSQRNTGTSDVTFPGFRQHTTGITTSVSADAAGSVVGILVPPHSPGNIGTNLNVTIDISH